MPLPIWNELAQATGLTLSDEQAGKLSQYLDLLLEANQRMNLTRIESREAAELQHVGDALTLLTYLPREAHRLVDVGSGGGVPGIPLAIARPDVTVTLVEATQKKAAFLKSAAEALGLTNLNVRAERAEDVGHSELREAFDVAVARAVGTLDFLAEWCLPLVRRGGKFLAMKGPKVTEELPRARFAIKRLGGGEPVIHPVGRAEFGNHVIVEIPKVQKTDARYPRPASVAKGKPLA
jgi:16S rRNA (guanine527-N7)-methyltransferase